MEEAELSKPEALESESAVKSSADIKAQEEAVREARAKKQDIRLHLGFIFNHIGT